MEFVDLLYLAVVAILAIFIDVTAVIFVFLQWWSWLGHGDALQKEKTVILLPFRAARPAAWFAFTESKFREKAIISQRRRFDLLLAGEDSGPSHGRGGQHSGGLPL
jgi:hypothetical protein